MKKMKIGKCLYSVMDVSEYGELDPELTNPKTTAIELGNGVVLPMKTNYIANKSTEPGIYDLDKDDTMASIIIKPSEQNLPEYSSENIIDYSNPSTIKDIIEKNELVRNIEKEILTNKDNILDLNISDKDTPEMKATKTAINAKQVDKKAYETRFDQYQNDMRLLKGHKITLPKLVSICEKFDISATLILEDKNDDVPNPIGNKIVVSLTEGRDQ